MSGVFAPKNTTARQYDNSREVWVMDEEKTMIMRLANETGLSHSAYLSIADLNRPVGARAGLEAVRELVKLNGDLNRVPNLLKLWLTEKRGQRARPIDVERVII